MKTILALGQSNAQGAAPDGVWTFLSSVTVWNCDGDSTSSTIGLGTAFVAPVRNSPPFFANNNMMAHAARYLAAMLGESVRLVLVAKSGQAFSAWCNQSGVTGPMQARTKAVLAAAGVSSVDAVFVMQGEQDVTAGTTGTWAASFNAWLAHMQTDGYITSSTPVVIGEVATPNEILNVVFRSLAAASTRIGLARISTFVISAPITSIHYAGTALVRAGLELARELRKRPGVFYSPPAPSPDYVATAGNATYTSAPSVYTKVPVKVENGNAALIVNGSFVSDRVGVWEFSVSAWTYTGNLGVCLLDETGAAIRLIAGTGALDPAANTAYINGSATLALGVGDAVSLGVVQASGVTQPISPEGSALVNRMTVKFLGAE